MKSPVPHLQNEQEFDMFMEQYYLKHSPKTVLEIGSFYGATLWNFIEYNDNLRKIVSIDLPIPPSDGRYNEMLKSRALWKSWVAGKEVELIDIQGDSHNPETLALISNERFDFIFIDGDHSYEGVKKDWEMYSPLINKGGLVVFHDSTGYDSVKKLCDEIRLTHSTDEIYVQGGWGLFVVKF